MELLTVREAANALGISPVTVRRYIATGRLSVVSVDGKMRVRRDVVDQLAVPTKPVVDGARIPSGKPFTTEDPLWNIVGIGRSACEVDVSGNKHEYLAKAHSAEQG